VNGFFYRPTGIVLQQALKDRNGKGCGFSCTGLSASQQVASFENKRNGFGLNGGWMAVSLFLKCAEYWVNDM